MYDREPKGILLVGSILVMGIIFIIVVAYSVNPNLFSEFAKEETKVEEVKEEVEPKLLTQKELAEYLGITLKEAQELGPVKAGESVTTSTLPFVELGGVYYFSRAEVDNWLGENKKGDE